MNKKLLIFLIISLCLHICLIVFIKIEKPVASKEKPVFVNIVKKKKEKTLTEKRLPEKKILSDKNEILRKKGKQKKVKKIPVKKKKKPLIIKPKKKMIPSVKKRPKEKVIAKQKKQTKKKGFRINEPKREEKYVNKPILNGKKEEKKVLPPSKKEKLSEEKIAKILNPKDILSKYVQESDAGSKEGEDDVDVAKMKFKYASYFRKFERRLYQVWHYPRNAAMKGQEGTVKIKFTILKDGTITNIKILQSSGYPMLDREAMRALKTMRGVPLPESYGLKRLNVTGYFAYHLNYMVVY